MRARAHIKGEMIKEVPMRTSSYIMQKGVDHFIGLNGRSADKPTKVVRGLTAAKKECNEIRDPSTGGLICSGIYQKEGVAGKEEDWEEVDWILKLFLQSCSHYFACFIHGGDEIVFFRQQYTVAEMLDECTNTKNCGCVKFDTRTNYRIRGQTSFTLHAGTDTKFDDENLIWSFHQTDGDVSPGLYGSPPQMRSLKTKDGQKCVADEKVGAKWAPVEGAGIVEKKFGKFGEWVSTACTPGCSE